MQYPLYEFYKQSSFNLYDVREHFLEHFYYMYHSRNDAANVLKAIVSSSKIESLIKESANRQIFPRYDDFLSTICSMIKFMFKSNDTQILATLDAALRWDVEVNEELVLAAQGSIAQYYFFNELLIIREAK